MDEVRGGRGVISLCWHLPIRCLLHWYISSDLAPDRYSVDPHVCDRLHRVRAFTFPVIKRPKPTQLRAQLSDLKRCVTSYPVVCDSLTPHSPQVIPSVPVPREMAVLFSARQRMKA